MFDLGNVLVHITLNAPEAFARTELTLPESYHDPAVQARLRELHTERETGRMHCGRYYEIVSELVGLAIEDVVTVSEAWLIRAFDGAADLLHEICGNGYQVACLSNTNAQHIGFVNDPRHPGYLPLHKLDYRFFSFAVGAMKPDPAIYEHVEAITGVVPGQILFFDDREENLTIAQQRGWQTCLIDHTADPIVQIRMRLEGVGIGD